MLCICMMSWLGLKDCRTSVIVSGCVYKCTKYNNFCSFLYRTSLCGQGILNRPKSSEYTYTPYWFTWVAQIWEPTTSLCDRNCLVSIFFGVFGAVSTAFTITVYTVSNNKLCEIQWVTISYGTCMWIRVALLTATTMCNFKRGVAKKSK